VTVAVAALSIDTDADYSILSLIENFSMLIKSSDLSKSNTQAVGAFHCKMPYPPDNITTTEMRMVRDRPKQFFAVEATRIRDDGSNFFTFTVPNRVLSAPSSQENISTNGSGGVSVHVLHFAVGGAIHVYLSHTGLIKFSYLDETLTATFRFATAEAEIFDGDFHVKGFD
jgi:hypothetical protein